MQVAEALLKYGREMGARVLPVYGGQPIGQQLRGLRRGVDVVVATPGRAVDHLKRGSLRLDGVKVVILDEADEMLDMGFAEDLETILAATPADRQTALFSATISPTITRIAKRHLREPGPDQGPRREDAARRRRPRPPGRLRRPAQRQARGAVPHPRRRGPDLDAGLRPHPRRGGRPGRGAERPRPRRRRAPRRARSRKARDRIMGRFRDGSLDVLVATDVAARGLDIEHVSHVVNFDVPSNPDAYVHRIGRTGRAGREGVAITLVEPREHRMLRNIEAATHTKLEIAHLPTVADLRERRTEILRANLREALLADGYDRFRGVVEPLTDEFDLVDIALAAVSLIEGAGGAGRRRGRAVLAAARGTRSAAPGRPAGASRAGGRSRPGSAARPGRRARRQRRGRPTRSGGRGSACSSVAAGARASGRATSSAPSPTRRTSPAASSARSRSTRASRWSTSRRASPTTSVAALATRPSAAGGSRSAATA